MHYNDDELYFYLKNDISAAKKGEIEKHLGSCPACAGSLGALKHMNRLFTAPMLEPPAFDPARKSARLKAPVRIVLFKPVLAGAFAMALAISAIVIFHFRNAPDRENVSSFVYNAYSSIYGDDYSAQNYLDESAIITPGGTK